MKLFSLVALLLFTGCAGGPIRDTWTVGLVGQKGYLRQPSGVTSYPGKGWAESSEFKQCEPIEITEVVSAGMFRAFLAKQNGKVFYLRGADDFITAYKLNPTPEKVREYIVPSKEEALGKNRKVKVTSGTFNSHELVCTSKIWTGMTPNELTFVLGKPDDINRTVMAGAQREQWVYKVGDYKQHFYYFANNVLTSWQD